MTVPGGAHPHSLAVPERRFDRLIQLSPDIIFSLSSDSIILSLNPAFEALTGWSDTEWIGQPLSALVYIDDAQVLFEALNAVRRGRTSRLVELRLRTKGGECLFVECSLFAETSEGGESTIVGLARDTTLPKRMAETLRQREAQLQQAQKMEAIGRLAGGIAHDFNNLLTIITGYSQLLLGRLRTDDAVRPDVEEIRKAAVRAASLTQQLLTFSRRHVMTPKVLNLNTVIETLDAMLQRLIGEDVHLVTALAPDLGRIHADPSQIEQVIMNLVINARDAMPQGGRVTIETVMIEVTTPFDAVDGPIAPGRYVVLSIQDNGCGMDAATQARIFEPFFTTKEQGKGTGLGLATVYGIVKQSNGHIVVESRVGEGTNFRLYLPVVEPVPDVAEAAKAPVAVPSGTETILLVEDEPTVRVLIRDTLRSFGYTVLEARHGFEAQLIGGQRGGRLHLLMTDVVMPQMSGRALADELRTAHPDLKVLYMSGYTESAMIDHGVLSSGSAFLQKPFTPELLARKVRETLDRNPRRHSGPPA